MSVHSLTLKREDFAAALKTATTGVRSEKAGFSVRLDFADGLLTATGPGAAGMAPAVGSWPAAVLIDAMAAKSLWPRLPTIDLFVVKAGAGRLSIGGFSLAATIMDVAPETVEVVLGSSHREVLIALARRGRPAVLASIGASALTRAEAAAERAAAAAVQSLKAFGVERAEIIEALKASLRRQARFPP